MTATADPLGGSYFIESLTDELEARAETLIETVDGLGGAVEAIDSRVSFRLKSSKPPMSGRVKSNRSVE